MKKTKIDKVISGLALLFLILLFNFTPLSELNLFVQIILIFVLGFSLVFILELIVVKLNLRKND